MNSSLVLQSIRHELPLPEKLGQDYFFAFLHGAANSPKCIKKWGWGIVRFRDVLVVGINAMRDEDVHAKTALYVVPWKMSSSSVCDKCCWDSTNITKATLRLGWQCRVHNVIERLVHDVLSLILESSYRRSLKEGERPPLLLIGDNAGESRISQLLVMI